MAGPLGRTTARSGRNVANRTNTRTSRRAADFPARTIGHSRSLVTTPPLNGSAQRASHSPSPAQRAGKGFPDHVVRRPNGPRIPLRLSTVFVERLSWGAERGPKAPPGSERGEEATCWARPPAGGPGRVAAGGLEIPPARPARSPGHPSRRSVSERSSGPPEQSLGAGGPAATPARSAGTRESRPSPRSAAGHDRLPQLRQTTPRSPTPGPPRRPSTRRPSNLSPAALSLGPPAAGVLRQHGQANRHAGRQTNPGVNAQASACGGPLTVAFGNRWFQGGWPRLGF